MNRVERGSRSQQLHDGVGIVCAVLGLLAFVVVVPCAAQAQTLSIAETENLVRSIHFEGLPEDQARAIGSDGATRLIEMLADPTESASHANTLLALGLCGQPGAFEAIRDWAAMSQGREGEVDRDLFRAWQALPFALGHLAEHDRRAVARLERWMNDAPPNWHFRHHRGARLHRLSRRAAARALGDSGLPEARGALERAVQNTTDPEFVEDLRQAREVHGQRLRGAVR